MNTTYDIVVIGAGIVGAARADASCLRDGRSGGVARIPYRLRSLMNRFGGYCATSRPVRRSRAAPCHMLLTALRSYCCTRRVFVVERRPDYGWRTLMPSRA